jgi:hypothetical protein
VENGILGLKLLGTLADTQFVPGAYRPGAGAEVAVACWS